MWRALAEHSDRRVAKLHRLKDAAAAGLTVPVTVWLPATEAATCDGDLGVAPSERGWVVRSAAPDEDGVITSRAGHYLSRHVPADADRAARAAAVAAVVASLVRDGEPRGAVFVQPAVVAERGGVAFFDGYWVERSEAARDNVALTHGEARGEVVRAHVDAPPDALGRFLERARVACAADVVDVEYTRSGDALTLLQMRPASFEVRRNPILSLANHREILGEVPSPWITSVLARAGTRVTSWFGDIDPVVASWRERYAIVVHGRPWMNFSFFYRVFDRWGLPRAWVTAGVGGAEEGASRREELALGRLEVRPLAKLQAKGLARIALIPGLLDKANARVRAATSAQDLFLANVHAMELAITTNFAIGGLLTGWTRLRRPFGLGAGAPLVTTRMMHDFDALRALSPREREAALDRWLTEHGHRGPLESDPARPRFAELRPRLLAELASGAAPARGAGPDVAHERRRWFAAPARSLTSLAFYPDRLRERFRDDLMRLWQTIRQRALRLAKEQVDNGHLDAPDDVFYLDGDALATPPRTWRELVAAAKEAHARHLALVVPVTADLDTLRALGHGASAASGRVLSGIGIGSGSARGRVVRARELDDVLGRDGGADAILVVPSLEPSWAVVFPRFAAVVSELGGELSHAAILLREGRRRAVVDCRGSFAALSEGEEIVVDAERGSVTRLSMPIS